MTMRPEFHAVAYVRPFVVGLKFDYTAEDAATIVDALPYPETSEERLIVYMLKVQAGIIDEDSQS